MTTSPEWPPVFPQEVREVLERELPAVAREVIEAISQEVPEYVRPFEGEFGAAVQTGVDEALRRFIGWLGDPGATPDAGREVYVALGRGEFRAGRTLDALQAAYRIGARAAWRRFARAATRARLKTEYVAGLAEAMFAYIDELSAESVEGYAQAQSELAGQREQERRELMAALLSPTPGVDVTALAAIAGWTLPRTAAALACPLERLAGIARRIGPDVLTAPFDGHGCVVVPDAEAPGRRDSVRVAIGPRHAAMGPDVPLAQLSDSWQLACAALGAVDVPGLAIADEHLTSLLLHVRAPIVDRLAAVRLSVLNELTPAARVRMTETALAYIGSQGNAAATARALHVHPQTARYRIARLRELFGAQLDDPEARFQIEVALRGTTVA